MSEEKIIDPSAAINQINNTLLALAKLAALANPEEAKKHLGVAVLASRNIGSGDEFVYEIYQKVFPGQDLPTTYSLDIPKPKGQ
ncbi:hypothetical protein [Pseudomonas syringae]|uniref:hypothetical protein n=1 Tax=Pseudomonas syringae TaxID=317 RepID=UPI000466809A|nr:hypothetical protein [Pseudomonas syringae]